MEYFEDKQESCCSGQFGGTSEERYEYFHITIIKSVSGAYSL